MSEEVIIINAPDSKSVFVKDLAPAVKRSGNRISFCIAGEVRDEKELSAYADALLAAAEEIAARLKSDESRQLFSQVPLPGLPELED